MSDKPTILERAMEKALRNGWDGNLKGVVFRQYDNPEEPTTISSQIIYQHNFAKALWGDEPTMEHQWVDSDGIVTGRDIQLHWQFHLQQMVIADYPIAYLGEHL